MTDLLVMLTKRIAELRQAGLEACHYVEEFFVRRIHPLGHRKTLAFECLRMTYQESTIPRVMTMEAKKHLQLGRQFLI
jgi:hypothetical protein